jgi:small subunit ribosomal protein S1
MTSDLTPHGPADLPDPDDERPSDDFARALAEFERAARPAQAARGASSDLTVGSRVKGRIISIGPEHVLIDHGGRSEAVAETRHFRADDGTLRVTEGQEVELFVVTADDQVMLAPSVRADAHAAQRQLREAKAGGIPVTGRVTGLNSGGLQVELGGARGFCPMSQVESGFCADASVYVGRTLEFLVTAVEEGRGGAVLSRRALLKRAEEEAARQLLATLKPGDEREGRVTRLEAFGAFVDLGGVEGMVHVSEIRHERTNHPQDALAPGDAVRVRVLRLESGRDGRPRIALSIRACAPDPWDTAPARFAVGARVTGTVARLADFGAFVTLAPGIDGLVHVSQVARGRVNHAREVLAAGQEVEAVVLSVDVAQRRIALSIREALGALPDEPAPAARTTAASRPAPTPAAPAPPARPAPEEPTTMALALRKAREAAARKAAGS